MKNKVVPLRVSENLLELIALSGLEQRTDKATTMRQWLYQGAEDYALQLIEQGRLSATRAAELLEISVYDIYRLAESQGVSFGATKEQYQKSLDEAAHHQMVPET